MRYFFALPLINCGLGLQRLLLKNSSHLRFEMNPTTLPHPLWGVVAAEESHRFVSGRMYQA